MIQYEYGIVHFVFQGVAGQPYFLFLSLEIVFILANRAEPDEMLLYAAFYVGLHSLPKYLRPLVISVPKFFVLISQPKHMLKLMGQDILIILHPKNLFIYICGTCLPISMTKRVKSNNEISTI